MVHACIKSELKDGAFYTYACDFTKDINIVEFLNEETNKGIIELKIFETTEQALDYAEKENKGV